MKNEEKHKDELDDLSFDKLLSERLHSKPEQSGEDLWSAISDRLDQEEELFEEAIKQKIESAELTDSEKSWSIIDSKLQEYRQVKTDIIVTKVLEFIGILILLGALTPYSSILDSSKTLYSGTHRVLAKTKPYVQKAADALDNITTAFTAQESIQSNNQPKDSGPSQNLNDSDSTIPNSNPFFLEGMDTREKQKSESIPTSAPRASIDERMIEIQELHQEVAELTYRKRIRRLTIIPDYSYSAKHVSKEIRSKKYFGIHAGVDYNIIKRPFDLQFLKQPQNYGAVGYTYSFNYSARKNRFEIGTGIVYNYKTYDPDQHENITTSSAFYQREFKGQKLSIIGAPLILRWHFGNLDKPHFYAGANMQTNFIISADYDLNTVLKNGTPSQITDIDESSKLSDKEFTEGIFEGGAVGDNIYLASGVHLGVEVPVKFGTFVIGSQYQHQLFSSKLGPNNEKFASVSLLAGWRVKL